MHFWGILWKFVESLHFNLIRFKADDAAAVAQQLVEILALQAALLLKNMDCLEFFQD